MISPGDIISHTEMCAAEGANLQRGMNFQLNNQLSVILMSVRQGAPYSDRIEDEGKVLIYEGHDTPRWRNGPEPKTVDQPMHNPGGSLTQNGLFWAAVQARKDGLTEPELVKVYEKLRAGIWVYNGLFKLVDAWMEPSNGRQVFKFKLALVEEVVSFQQSEEIKDLDHNRMIPTEVKLKVWKRDSGRCVRCQSQDNLHFDHIIPYSRGGSSLITENIQILCARHNLQKSAKIE